MRNLILILMFLLVLAGCQKDDGITEDTVKQCRDSVTGQFVVCP